MTGHGHHNHHGQTHQPKRAHPLAHGRRGIAKKFAQMRGTGKGLVVALLAVLGPGMLAGRLIAGPPVASLFNSIASASLGARGTFCL